MHSLLENYLAELTVPLSALPAKRRSEELREMRAHLENAFAVYQEQGQTEDEAAQAALAQFGAAQVVGEKTVTAWRRGEAISGRSFFGAAVSAPLMLTCVLLLQNHFIGFLAYLLPSWLDRYCGKHPDIITGLVQGVFLTIFGLTGLVAGSVFPKRAVRGVCLGLIIFWIGWAGVEGIGYGGSVWRFLVRIYSDGWTLTAIIFAWLGSRSRLVWRRQQVSHS